MFYIFFSAEEEPFNVASIQKQLRTLYFEKRGKIPRFPGVPESFADMQEFYIDLELEENRQGQLGTGQSRKLDSYEELVALRSQSGYHLKRLLASGVAGIGKTTLVSRLAHDWAMNKTYISGYEMLFALDICYIKTHMNLMDVLQNQLLSRVSRQGMLDYLSHNASSVMFIFDGYDVCSEQFLHGQRDIKDVFQSKWLQDSFVLVTTRPHMVAKFTKMFGVCANVKLQGLSPHNIGEYVVKFTNADNMDREECDRVRTLTSFLQEDHHTRRFYSIPIILSMVCISWNRTHVLPDRITPLYENALMFLAEHKGNISADNELSLKSVVQALGKPAFLHLLEAEDQLIFTPNEFNSTVLDYAYRIGIVSKERHYFDTSVEHASFIHKTFQEYCAAVYFVSLFDTRRALFNKYLFEICYEMPEGFEFVLRFSCGLSREAASVIISHLVHLFPPVEVLSIGDRLYQDNFGLIENLLYDAHDCDLVMLLQPIFARVRRLNLYTGTVEPYRWSVAEFLISCVLESKDGELSKTLFGNVNKADLKFNEATLGFLNVLALTPLQEFTLKYKCSDSVLTFGLDIILVSYEHHINSVSKLKIESDVDYHIILDKEYTASCIAPLLKSIHSLFGKWGYLESVSLQEVISIRFRCSDYIPFQVHHPRFIDLVFQEITLSHFDLYGKNIGENNPARLHKAAENSRLQILKINNDMDIEPFLPILQNLTINNKYNEYHLCYGHDGEQTIERLFKMIVGHVSAGLNTKHYTAYQCKQYMPLKKLVISRYDINDNLYLLLMSIKCMPNLQVLKLHKTGLGANDMITFRQTFTDKLFSECRVYLPLIELDLSGNRLNGNKSIGNLTAALKCLPQLQYLALGYGNLNASDIEQLSLGLYNNMPNLKELDLGGIVIGDAIADLSKAISSHKNLHVLRLNETDAKCAFSLKFNFKCSSCLLDSCHMTCSYVKHLPNHLLCSICSYFLQWEDDFTVSRHLSTNIDKPRFEFLTDFGPITVFNLGNNDSFVCKSEKRMEFLNSLETDDNLKAGAEEQKEYLNCLVTDNNLKALVMCRKLAESLNITLN